MTIDLIEYSYEEFKNKFTDLGLANPKVDLNKKLESLQDQDVKEFLLLFNEMAMNQNQSEQLRLRPLRYALTPDHDFVREADKKLEFLVTNNLLLDKMILQRDDDLFYGFLPEGYKGLTLLEHAISKNYFALAKAIKDRLSNIDQSLLSSEEKEILASQKELYEYYKDSIVHKAKISELDVFTRSYSFKSAMANGDKKLKKALLAAALPFNLETLTCLLPDNNLYAQDINPYDYILSDNTDKLLTIFESTHLTASDIAYITDNKFIARQEKTPRSKFSKYNLEKMRIEYLSRTNPTLLSAKYQSIKNNAQERDKFINQLVEVSDLSKDSDTLKMIIEDILKNNIEIKDKQLIKSLLLSSAGYIPEKFHLLQHYAAQRKVFIDMAEPESQDAIIVAAIHGNAEFVKKLIAIGDKNNLQKTSALSLIYAVAYGHVDTIKVLIEAGANINFQDEYGLTALNSAASHGSLDTVKVLIEAGANINFQNQLGITTLVFAASKGKTDIVKFLIKSSTKPIPNHQMDIALVNAAEIGHLDTVKALIEEGADINYKLKKEFSALKCAADKGHLEIVEFLLINGAKTNPKNNMTNRMLEIIETQKVALKINQPIDHERTKIHKIKTLIKAFEKLEILKSQDEIDEKDILFIRDIFNDLSTNVQEHFIKNLKSELLKHVAREIQDKDNIQKNDAHYKLKNMLTGAKKLSEKEKFDLLQEACNTGDEVALKLLLESKADYTKLDYTKIGDDMKKLLRSYGIKQKTQMMKESDIIENISLLNRGQLREVFNNVDPNKYKQEINKALLNKNLNDQEKNEFVLFLLKKGFDPKNITADSCKKFVDELKNAKNSLVDEKKAKLAVKIIDDVISKTSASDKVSSDKIYIKMQEAGLIDKNITEDKQKQIIKKINKITAEYNDQNRSHNFLKRAVRSLLHFIGVKYVGKQEAISVLSKINLPSSKKDTKTKER